MNRDQLSELVCRTAEKHGFSVVNNHTVSRNRAYHIAACKGDKALVFQLHGRDAGGVSKAYFDFDRRTSEFKRETGKKVLALFSEDRAGKEKKDTTAVVRARLPKGIVLADVANLDKLFV